MSVVQFATLSVTCPALSSLRKNLNGLRRLLEVCMKRLTDPASNTAINAQLVAKFTDAVTAKAILSYPYEWIIMVYLEPLKKGLMIFFYFIWFSFREFSTLLSISWILRTFLQNLVTVHCSG